MRNKMLRTWIWLGSFLLLPISTLCAKSLPKKMLLVTVSVYNDAGVAVGTLRQAEEEASHAFRESGIEVRWLNCPLAAEEPEGSKICTEAVFPKHLQLRIAGRSIGLTESTMGISYLSADDSGCYVDLFYEPVKELHNSSHVSVASILGHVAAHEIGHLLLGTNSHASSGIMRAQWQSGELASVRKGRLLFSDKESRQMRGRLAAMLAKGNEASDMAAQMGN